MEKCICYYLFLIILRLVQLKCDLFSILKDSNMIWKLSRIALIDEKFVGVAEIYENKSLSFLMLDIVTF